MEHFPKAPIQEALLDVQVVLPPETAALDLKQYGKGLEARFPECNEHFQFVQSIQLAADQQQVPPTKSVEGYLYTSKADGKIVQARRDGFTFNKLRPYSQWEAFSTEARELWQRYLDFAHPTGVRRLGLRYINRIEIPADLANLGELCVLFPETPAGVPGTWFEFFQRFASMRDDGYLSIVTLALDLPDGRGKPAIILDVDVVRHLANVKPDTNELWACFEQMRALKNQIFGASLTDRARDLFR